jgi:hypothetical protein
MIVEIFLNTVDVCIIRMCYECKLIKLIASIIIKKIMLLISNSPNTGFIRASPKIKWPTRTTNFLYECGLQAKKIGRFSCQVGQTHNTQIWFTAALFRERESIYIFICEVWAFFDIGLCKNQVNILMKEHRWNTE